MDTSFSAINAQNFELVDADDLMFNEQITGLMSACCKLYSSSILQDVRFDEKLIYSEDTIFLFNLFLRFSKVGIIDEVLYYYYHRQGSATRAKFKVEKSNTLIEFSNLCDLLYEKKKYLMLDQMIVYMFKFILTVRTQSYGLDCYKKINGICKKIGKKWLKRVLNSEFILLKTKLEFIVFFYSRHTYELARLIADPTMKVFYKNRRKHNG